LNRQKKQSYQKANQSQNLLNYIDNSFVEAVETIYNTKGRLVVTGIGKSAIIAQKIVAT
jgi:arabinose-5-phosphate isomerase